MTEPWGLSPAPKRTRGRRFWTTLAVAVVVIILLLFVAPIALIILGILAIIFGLVVLLPGHARWARIPNRKAAGGLAGVSFVLVIVASIVAAGSMPVPVADSDPVAAPVVHTEAAAPSAEPELASYVGQTCEADHLVMTQGAENNYCDDDGTGAFVWVTAADHEKAEAKALALASQQAADQAKAQEAAASKAAAETKAKAKAEVKKAATAAKAKQAAAAKKAATQAQAKKAAEQAQARKAAQAAQQRAAEKAAAAKTRSVVEQPVVPKKTAPSATFYQNCTAVRNAGADPIYAGQPGYSRKLDRDGDGVACE